MTARADVVADLHLHSLCSDGQIAPAEVVERAAAAGLQAISLTDHDSLGGIPEAGEQARRCGLTLIPGVELSTQCLDQDVHLLGYGFFADRAPLAEHLQRFRRARQERFAKIIARLREAGLAVEAEGQQVLDSCPAPGRLHAALILVQKKMVADIAEAFRRYLREKGVAWVPKYRLPLAEGIALIQDSGGLAVLAHPGTYARSKAIIAQALAAGADGLEVFHSKHQPAQERGFLQICKQDKILILGGSDCHFCPGEKEGSNVGGKGIAEGDWHAFQEALGRRRER